MVAPTGARRTKREHPALPITPEEIAETASACASAGATALHLHVREADGRHSLDPGRYREAMAAVSEAAPGLAIQVTTERAGMVGEGEPRACLEALRPGWASLAVREASEDAADALYGFCAAEGVRLQHILFDAADAALLARRRAAGVVRPGQNEVILVLGAYAPPQEGAPDAMPARIAALGADTLWSVCAFGRAEQACLTRAAALGAASVRAGFENNLQRPDGALWRDNADAVAALKTALEAAMQTAEARA